MRPLLRPAVNLLRSALGTNSISERLAVVESKLDKLSTTVEGNNPARPPQMMKTSTAFAPDINHLLHQCRSAMMRDMPPGGRRILSAGCAASWYFKWVAETYGHVEEHLGIELYAPRPNDLPDNVTWFATTAGNMEGVESASCDLVISGQNIEHLWPEEVAGFLLEAARVLRPGGYVAVDSPNRELTSLLNWSNPEHTIELTVAEITQLLKLAGFDITKTAGLWLCRDPKTRRTLPLDPTRPDTDWTATERIVSGRDKPEHAFLWWVEGRRTATVPDSATIKATLAEIFSRAWPERTTRMVIGPNRNVERRNDTEWVIARAHAPGVVVYGPYMPLRAGHYRVTFNIIADPGTREPFAICDVAIRSGITVLKSRSVDPTNRSITLDFTLDDLGFGAEFRCHSLGTGGFAVRRAVELLEIRD